MGTQRRASFQTLWSTLPDLADPWDHPLPANVHTTPARTQGSRPESFQEELNDQAERSKQNTVGQNSLLNPPILTIMTVDNRSMKSHVQPMPSLQQTEQTEENAGRKTENRNPKTGIRPCWPNGHNHCARFNVCIDTHGTLPAADHCVSLRSSLPQTSMFLVFFHIG